MASGIWRRLPGYVVGLLLLAIPFSIVFFPIALIVLPLVIVLLVRRQSA